MSNILETFTRMLTGGNPTIAKVEKPTTNGKPLWYIDDTGIIAIPEKLLAIERPQTKYEILLHCYLKQLITRSFQPAFTERLGKNRIWLPQTPIFTGTRQETIGIAAEFFARFIINNGLECSNMILVPQYFGHKQTRYSLIVTLSPAELKKRK